MGPRRPALLLALAAIGALAFLAAPARAEPCPQLATRIKAKTVPGRKIQSAVVIKNLGLSFVDNAVLRFGLPPATDLVSVKAAASPARTKTGRIQRRRAGDAVFFLDLSFKPGQTRKFIVKGKQANCEPAAFNFTSLTYVVDPATDAASCPSPVHTAAVEAPGIGRWKKRGCTPLTLSPTAAGSNGTEIGFEPFGVGQRCLEAGRLAPFTTDRRRLDTRRQLQPAVIQSPYDCWVYCSNYDSESSTPPFYFNWNTVTSQCFCCGR